MSRRVSSLEPDHRMSSHAYAHRLLDDMASDRTSPEFVASKPAIAWADSGAMWLTGPAGGAPRLAPSGIPRAVEGAFRALTVLTGAGPLASLDPHALLSERAAHFGGSRGGRISAGRSCRLLPSRDGWIALNLARQDDWALLAAWFEDATFEVSRIENATAVPSGGEEADAGGADNAEAVWGTVKERVAQRVSRELIDRGRLLGLPVASAFPDVTSAALRPSWRRVVAAGTSVVRAPEAVPRVLDLSALWAGPLCSNLLCLGGAEVIKLESWERPDGARAGALGFFDLLHAGKRSVAVELRSERGRDRLRQLIDAADIVIESSRPRALAQLGLDAGACVQARPGLSWISITGYGRAEPEANWVAFGDDAAVSAGLAHAIADADGPMFCADAIADPLTGLHAAVAALGSFRRGGGHLIDLNLRDVSAFALGAGAGTDTGTTCSAATVIETDRPGDFELIVDRERFPISKPKTRAARGEAEALGASNSSIFERLGRTC